MKTVTKKSTIQKIIFAIAIILLLVNFILVPTTRVYADVNEDDDHGWSIGGTLAKEVLGFFNWICDVLMGGLNNVMLGANGVGSAMLDKNNPNLTDESSWIYVEDPGSVDKTDDRTIVFENGEIDTSITGWFGAAYAIPNMLYSPENIFANNIAALDVNFLRQNSYQSIYAGGKDSFKKSADEKAESAVKTLRETIANWYKSFRNIAVVGLLTVLIYLGIRILISSTASDKAKYKETLRDWVVALCLVFVIHFIMSGILMLTDKCTELFGKSVDEGYTIVMEGEKRSDNKDMAFHTNLMGLIRFSAQNRSSSTTAFYSIMYWGLVIYTCIFTIIYFKRFLYMAFFTMIAPLVALTYPIDRVGDGKSQAFNMWFKEYTMNAIIQPVHLILYTVFVGSAYHLVAKNPVYALVALAFLIPAEKFVKKMFGLDKAESTSGFGSFAGGAMAMSAIKSLSNLGSGGKNKKGAGDKSESGAEGSDDGIFMPSNQDGNLSAFENTNDEGEARQQMLDTDDENFGAGDWDAQQRDALAREQNNDGGTQYSDDEYAQILRDSGYDEDTIRQMTGSNSSSNTSNNQIKPKRSVVRALGRVAGRGASAAGRQIWKNKGKLVSGVGRFAAKTTLRAAGAAALAMPALAAGITTGDLSKTAQFVGAGAMVGSGLGSKAYDGIAAPLAGGVANTARNSRNAFEEEYFGMEEAAKRQRERQNEKATKAFMQNEKEIKKYRKLKSDIGYGGSYKDLMSAAADYKVAGVTDDKMIQNALKAEARNNHGKVGGNDHKQYVDMASFASQNGFGKDHIEDDKKRTAFENVIDSKLSNQRDKRKAAQTLAEIFDRGEMYKNVGKFGETKKK